MKIRFILFAVFAVLFGEAPVASTQNATVTEVSSNVLVFATSAGNVVASVGVDGALLVGTPSASSTAEISKFLKSRTNSAFRYVVIAPQRPEDSEGDAGWGRAGAFVAMQESALEQLGGHAMGMGRPLPARFASLGVDRPHISFSDILSFDINGDAIHIIHQSPGYSNADSVVHFHVAGLVYFGEAFPGDGYPLIDEQQGGTLDGLIKTLSPWVAPNLRVVPARGKVMSGSDVKAFTDMITAVRDRVQRGIQGGQAEQQVLAAHPVADFDMRWGHGRVTGDDFIRSVYRSLKK